MHKIHRRVLVLATALLVAAIGVFLLVWLFFFQEPRAFASTMAPVLESFHGRIIYDYFPYTHPNESGLIHILDGTYHGRKIKIEIARPSNEPIYRIKKISIFVYDDEKYNFYTRYPTVAVQPGYITDDYISVSDVKYDTGNTRFKSLFEARYTTLELSRIESNLDTTLQEIVKYVLP